MFDPPQVPPPPPAPVKKARFKATKVTVGIVLMGVLGISALSHTAKPDSSPARVTAATSPSMTKTQLWLISNQDAISKYLADAGVYSDRLANAKSLSEMMAGCQGMLNMVDEYYFASWKTGVGAPDSWARLINVMHDGLTYCADGDFENGGTAIQQAAVQQDAFTQDIKAATP